MPAIPAPPRDLPTPAAAAFPADGAGAADAAREAFVALRLVPPLAAAAALPLLLVGAPAPGLAAGVLALFTPLVPAALARRGLPLGTARGAEALTHVAGAAALAAAFGAGALPFAAWGLALPLLAGRGRRAVGAALLAALAGVAAVLAGSGHGAATLAEVLPATLGVALAALAYGAAALAGARDEAEAGAADAAAWRARAEALAPRAADLVLLAGPGGLVREASGPGLDGLQASAALLGAGFLGRVVVGDRPALLKALADALADGAPRAVRLRLQAADGADGAARSWVADAGLVPLPRATGAAPLAFVLLRDAAPARAAEREAARARAAEAAAHEAAARIVATVSHELRTPLNAIIGFASMLGDPALRPADEAARLEYARIVKASGEHLLEVVNALLDASALAGGRLTLAREPLDLAVLARDALGMLRLRAAEGGIDLALEAPANLPAVPADRRALRQIILNLASNALKFTPPGGRVTVALARRGERLELSVEDTGIGISPADLPRVGEPFFQARGGYDRAHEGTGLGLSVVHGLVGLHGGEVAVESAPGAGTRVTVSLPLREPAAEGGGEVRPIRARPRRAVVRAVA